MNIVTELSKWNASSSVAAGPLSHSIASGNFKVIGKIWSHGFVKINIASMPQLGINWEFNHIS